MVIYCPKCGKEVSEEANFCPNCGSQIKIVLAKKSSFPIAAGILEIIAACVCMLIGILGILVPLVVMLTLGIFGFVGFAFGLTGGILKIKRKSFALAIIGSCMVQLSGFIMLITTALSCDIFIVGLVYGMPIIILSNLSLIFTAISKQEFH